MTFIQAELIEIKMNELRGLKSVNQSREAWGFDDFPLAEEFTRNFDCLKTWSPSFKPLSDDEFSRFLLFVSDLHRKMFRNHKQGFLLRFCRQVVDVFDNHNIALTPDDWTDEERMIIELALT